MVHDCSSFLLWNVSQIRIMGFGRSCDDQDTFGILESKLHDIWRGCFASLNISQTGDVSASFQEIDVIRRYGSW